MKNRESSFPPKTKIPSAAIAVLGSKNKDPTYGYAHSLRESRKLKQARPKGQYVDLLRREALATPSIYNDGIITQLKQNVNIFYSVLVLTLKAGLNLSNFKKLLTINTMHCIILCEKALCKFRLC